MKEWFGVWLYLSGIPFPGIYSHYVYISIHLIYLAAQKVLYEMTWTRW
jgi:hypothetical protein